MRLGGTLRLNGRPHKYRARARFVDGKYFASGAELKRWQDLQTMERCGEIRDLQRQVKFLLWTATEAGERVPLLTEKGNQRSYVADHVYRDRRNRLVVEDVKGYDTPESELKRDLVRACYGITVQVLR